ncbi:MAG: MerR family transcriptional regulator [Desulfobulbaceae bacterium]|jgi:DNA-binding transcriptional MerR regulator|nr:MAG: MerR family transcriptional regulator [Desulfobulbaceae bacterium]
MFTNELAKEVGVNASVIRYYTRIGLLDPERDPGNGYRDYAPKDIERVRFIRKAKWLGFTLRDVQTILQRSDAGRSPCQQVRGIILERIRENQQRLLHLQSIQDRMEAAIAAWDSLEDSPPGRHVCGLIDSLECDEEKLDLYAGYKF